MRLTRKYTGRLVLLAMAIVAGNAFAKDSLPEQTEDGLKLIESKHVDAVYWQEGATLDGYTKVMLVECAVAFKKDWMRDYNRDAASMSQRVSAEDMERIKSSLSQAFNEEFTKVLEAGGYSVVDTVGDDVLLVRPAIVNLDVTAPDLRNAGATRTYTASAGAMTLYMELYDAATGAKVGKVLDAQRARDDGYFSVSSNVSNRVEANRILKKWSQLLVNALDEANGK